MIVLKNDVDVVSDYLQSIDYLTTGEKISKLSSPGDGNMNFTLRVHTSERTFIIKQSRDYVEKYPQVAAPVDRAMQEAGFYAAIASDQELAGQTPSIYHADNVSNVLIMQDLGSGTDYSHHYQSHAAINRTDLDHLVAFIARLHTTQVANAAEASITNREMRQLNYEHMYVYPMLHDNGLDLDQVCPGLQATATALRNHPSLAKQMLALGDLYLADGESLLHGDYFLGSWLKVDGQTFVIDPEFCHHGKKEFEIGVMLAHLMLAHQPEESVHYCLSTYSNTVEIDDTMAMAFAGAEIIRRLIGLAQLPLTADLQQRQTLLDQAISLVLALPTTTY